MTSAVIVSTARTPLAKSWKGSFNMTHGATLGGHAQIGDKVFLGGLCAVHWRSVLWQVVPGVPCAGTVLHS